MAKGQMKTNKEAKKPKADKEKGAGSSYKQAQGSTLSADDRDLQKEEMIGRSRRNKSECRITRDGPAGFVGIYAFVKSAVLCSKG